MKNLAMKYKNYEFSANPKTVQVQSKRKILESALSDKSCEVENICREAVIVSGSGELFGEHAAEECMYLSGLFKQEDAGWLFCPCITPIRAYFSAFDYEFDSAKKSAVFHFEFTQESDRADYYEERDYTIAQEDENAFDIAERVGISVSTLMRLNTFENLFCIDEGERVKIR